MLEEWRDIEGYEGLYQVSNLGRVKSLKSQYGYRKIILKPRKNKYGYFHLQLHNKGNIKDCTIHRLVAQAFIPNPNNYPQINHKDENKLNNNVSNLEWCTAKYNTNYGTRNQRSSKSNKGKKRKSRYHTEETKRKMKENHADFNGKNNPVARRVINIDTGKVFDTIREASKYYNIKCQGNISEACRGKRNKVGGYNWKYID